MNDFTDQLTNSLPDILMGVVFLVIALVLGYVVKTLIVKGTRKLKLGRKLGNNSEDARSITELLGKLGFIITVLFFLPGIFDRFGLSSISEPLTGMVSTFFGFIPRLIGAGLLLFFGFVVAKVAQQLFKAFLKKMRVDRLKEKMGMDTNSVAENSSSLYIADLGGKVLYVVVLIPFIIAALEVLNIRAITDPAITMLNSITAVIPQLIAAGVLILIGIFIAKLIGDLVESLIEGFGLSRQVAEAMDEPKVNQFNLAKTIGIIVKALIILFFTVQAFELIGLGIFNTIGTAIIAYLPFVLKAIIILFGGYVLGSMAKKFIVNTLPDARFAGVIVKFTILSLAALIALSSLGIGTLFIQVLFVAIVAASAVAFAIAFGVGGRGFASNMLKKLENKMDENKDQMKDMKKKVEKKVEREDQKDNVKDQVEKVNPNTTPPHKVVKEDGPVVKDLNIKSTTTPPATKNNEDM
jgi:hypothetical protein